MPLSARPVISAADHNGAVRGSGGRDLRQGGLQQRRLVCRRAAGHGADVTADIEVRVIDPDRAAAAERRPDQPLTQPRHGRNPPGHQLPGLRKAKSAGVIEQQDDTKLLLDLPGVHRQKRAIGGARPLNHRPGGTAAPCCHSSS